MARLTEKEVIKLIDENHKKYLASLTFSDKIVYRLALLYVRVRNYVRGVYESSRKN